jgi:hypothetical protein
MTSRDEGTMKAEDHNIDRQWLLSYVLGDLSENETRIADERFFSDDTFAAALDETYRDLLHDYAAQTLPGAERERVKRAFFSGRYEGQRIAVLRAMRSFPRNAPSRARTAELRWKRPRRSFWLFAAPAFALVLTAVALAVFFHSRESYTSPNRNASSESAATKPAEQLAPSLPKTTSAPTSVATSGAVLEGAFTILLLPDVTRGSEPAGTYSVPPSAAKVNFQIVLPGNASGGTFDVRLGHANTSQLRSVNGLTAKKLEGQNYVEFAIPAADLPAGEYRVDVFSSDATKRPIAHFAVRVARDVAPPSQP